ncbi:MAG: hypothetical protein QXG31_00835, partial [Candidatus Bathyarchaeia archaeon]
EGKTQKLTALAELISRATGYVIPPNKAIVGAYAFAHESGIHTHGVLNDPVTYEPYPPELVGNRRKLTIGKHSGKAIIRYKIIEVTGKEPDPDKLTEVVQEVKKLYEAGRKASLKEEEFKRILQNVGLL